MKKKLLFFVAIFLTLSSFGQVVSVRQIQDIPLPPIISSIACGKPAKMWDKRFGGSGLDGYNNLSNATLDIIPTPSGGYLLSGYSASGVSGDKTEDSRGAGDYWIVKVDSIGNKIWDRRFGGSNDDIYQEATSATNGAVVIAGYTRSSNSGDKTEPSRGSEDYWAVKVDTNGNKVWDKRFGGSDTDFLHSICLAKDGGFLLGGRSFESSVGGDKTGTIRGQYDYWVVKVDSNGNKLWDKIFGGYGADFLKKVIATKDGGFLLGGFSNSDAGGDKSQNANGYSCYWVIKVDSLGNKVWDKSFGANNYLDVSGLIQTQDGKYIIGGYTLAGLGNDKTQPSRGSLDFWIVKMDSLGNKVWDKTFGGSGGDVLSKIISTTDGAYLLAGYSVSGISGEKTEASKGSDDFWIVKIDSDGNKIWDKTIGGSASDIMGSALINTDGSLMLLGNSSSGVSGDKTQASRGGRDFWMLNMGINCEESSSFCEGETITLTATGCAGTIAWSNGTSANSIFVSVAGTYTAICTVNSETSGPSNSIVVSSVSTSVNLSGISSGGTTKAIETITSTEIIPTSIKTTYRAGNSISLNGTFYAQTGSTFKAEIKGCN